MATSYYVRTGTKKYGPLSGSMLKKLAAEGKISRDDTLSADGVTKWVKAGGVKGLFPPAELIVGPEPAHAVIQRVPPPPPLNVPTAQPAQPIYYAHEQPSGMPVASKSYRPQLSSMPHKGTARQPFRSCWRRLLWRSVWCRYLAC